MKRSRARQRVHAVFALAWAWTCVAAACGSTTGPERELSGAVIYERNCARCHGVDGRPTAEAPGARDLRNASYMRSLSDERIRRMIEGGKPPSMPAFGGQFMEPSMKLLIAHVRSLSRAAEGTAGPAGSPEATAAAAGPPVEAAAGASPPKPSERD